MAVKKNVKIEGEDWYEEPVKKWFAIITGFISIATVGYIFASILLNIEFRMVKYEMNQEFHEKLQQQINLCEEEQQNTENRRVESIENIVKELQNKNNGKK